MLPVGRTIFPILVHGDGLKYRQQVDELVGCEKR